MRSRERHELKHDRYVDAVVDLAVRLGTHPRAIAVGSAAAILTVGIAIWLVVSARTAEATAWTRLAAADGQAFQAQVNPSKAETALRSAASGLEATCRLYPGTRAAKFARYRLGVVRVRQKQFAEAVRLFEEVLRRHDEPAELRTWSRRCLAGALEELGKFGDAAKQYGLLARSQSGMLAAASHWDAGRCHEAARKPDLAKPAYKEVVALAPSSRWGQLARFRLDHLDRPSKAAARVAPTQQSKGKPDAGVQPATAGKHSPSADKPEKSKSK